jgi:hypothetical protein
VFSSATSLALEAFESIVITTLLSKPNLTLMQLQQGLVVLSELETQEQLAAVALMLRGGFWVAAMLISYGDWGILAEVLQQMLLLVEAGLHLDLQVCEIMTPSERWRGRQYCLAGLRYCSPSKAL